MSIDRATFVLLGDYGVLESGEKGKNPLSVTLKGKNTSNSTVSVSAFSDIKDYDGDEQFAVETSYDTSLGFKSSPNYEIGAGNSKDVTLIRDLTML